MGRSAPFRSQSSSGRRAQLARHTHPHCGTSPTPHHASSYAASQRACRTQIGIRACAAQHKMHSHGHAAPRHGHAAGVMRPACHEAAASPSLPSHPASRHSAGFGSHLWTMASRHSVRQGNACVVCTAVHLAPQAPRRKFWPLLAEGGVILTRILQLRSR